MTGKIKKTRSVSARLFGDFFGRAGRLSWIVPFHLAAVVLTALFQSAIPRTSGWLIDRISANPQVFVSRWLIPCFLALAVICVVYYLNELFQKIFIVRINTEVKARFQIDLYRHLLLLSEDFYHRTQAGEISTRMTKDMDNGVDSFYWSVSQAFYSVIMFVSAGVVLATLHPALVAVYLGIFALWLVLNRFFFRKAYRMNRELNDRYGALSGQLTELISLQSLVRVFSKEKEQEEAVSRRISDYLARSLKLGRFTGAVFALMQAVLFYLAPVFLLYFSIVVFRLKFTAGELVAVYFTWIVACIPINMMMGYFPRVINCFTSISRILEFFDETPLVADEQNAPALAVTGGEIRLEQVDFTYPLRNRETVIREMDLVIPPKKRTAIVGPTGSGKSTIISLILRLYDPDRGRILIDGRDLRSVSQLSVRESIGLVMQDTILWSGTIRENMIFAKPGASDDEIRDALKNAQLLDFVLSTGDGLGTVLGEKGVRLSGGQKQRLAIGRVFLLDPRIVILDEATSSLDSMTEQSIHLAMERLFHDRTAVIVAHRLSTVLDCDKIIVMEKGRILREGSHPQLLESCPLYRDMCREQGIPV